MDKELLCCAGLPKSQKKQQQKKHLQIYPYAQNPAIYIVFFYLFSCHEDYSLKTL